MNTLGRGHQNFYFAEKNCQLKITNGSFSLRLIVLDHPLIEGEISINMGIAKAGTIIDTNYFYDLTGLNNLNNTIITAIIIIIDILINIIINLNFTRTN